MAGAAFVPVAVLIVNDEGVRLEPLKSGTASVLEKVGTAIGNAIESKSESSDS